MTTININGIECAHPDKAHVSNGEIWGLFLAGPEDEHDSWLFWDDATPENIHILDSAGVPITRADTKEANSEATARAGTCDWCGAEVPVGVQVCGRCLSTYLPEDVTAFESGDIPW